MKLWIKPITITLNSEQLTAQIEVAARSSHCLFGYFR